MRRLKVGTRASALALAQSEWVVARLRSYRPELSVEFVPITTRGDRSQAANVPLSSYTEKGVFAKEIEEALLAGEVDLAVHSMKDLAASLPDGLIFAAIPPREDPSDALIGHKLVDLASGARVGTGSVRRRALLHEKRPDLDILDIRGNVDTRLEKLEAGKYDAIVLAVAGLNRLGKCCVIAESLDPAWFTPDPGQGALAIQSREDNHVARDIAALLHDPVTAACVQAERAYLKALGGGCTTPIGAWATLAAPTEITLRVMRADPESGEVARLEISGPVADPERLGMTAADGIVATTP